MSMKGREIAQLKSQVALLERQLSTSIDKELCLLERLIEKDEYIAALERRTDDAKGKRCPECGEPLVSFSTMNERECSGCGAVWPWNLEPGQQPLIGSNRMGRQAPARQGSEVK